MNTRFSPSLNGSLHLGHLYMAWVNLTFARMHMGKFLLRFDDIAPRLAGDSVQDMASWASEAEMLLRQADLVPDQVTYLSSYGQPDEVYPTLVGGKNQWLRPADFEGHNNLGCSPMLVAARVRADIEEEIGVVIRGEELLVELQFYEYLNSALGGKPRELVYLPRLRVRCNGEVTTISKTVGNLQLRDLFKQASPQEWLDRVLKVVLVDCDRPLSWDNVHRDPIITIE